MKTAVITGALSGLAQAVIRRLLEDGYTVFEGDLKFTHEEVKGCEHFFPCDVTSSESIKAFYEYVASVTDHVDVITNFAGIVILGSFVEMPCDTLDRIMSVNMLSTFRINNIFFPLVKASKGRIINISSEYARITAIPIHGYYPLTKHAVDNYNDSLRRELQVHGIKVIGIRPGSFRTQMQGGIDHSFDVLLEETKYYKRFLTRIKFLMTGELKRAKDPDIVAKAYMKALHSRHPRYYYNVRNSFKMKLLKIFL
ncbi:MAG: SDR family NAD(P)-dependent oxidoreductase, partial [Bullifex sp.]